MSAAAEADAEEIWRWVANDSVRAAERLLERFDDVARMLAETPESGRRRDDLAPGIRAFPAGRYLLFYRPTPGGIEIVRVLHGHRDIDADLF